MITYKLSGFLDPFFLSPSDEGELCVFVESPISVLSVFLPRSIFSNLTCVLSSLWCLSQGHEIGRGGVSIAICLVILA